jgi:hypothetical protein
MVKVVALFALINVCLPAHSASTTKVERRFPNVADGLVAVNVTSFQKHTNKYFDFHYQHVTNDQRHSSHSNDPNKYDIFIF